WQAVPDDAFDAHWRAEAAHLARGPGLAYREIKRALQAAAGQDLPAQLAHEAAGQARCGASADFREGVAAFLEKRAPRFAGR
ncbi:2-(1,2-epoxy-1,2-dihydrophenyl)acetyl-CoA isomerase, partial [Thioclava sp. BHET1]